MLEKGIEHARPEAGDVGLTAAGSGTDGAADILRPSQIDAVQRRLGEKRLQVFRWSGRKPPQQKPPGSGRPQGIAESGDDLPNERQVGLPNPHLQADETAFLQPSPMLGQGCERHRERSSMFPETIRKRRMRQVTAKKVTAECNLVPVPAVPHRPVKRGLRFSR